MKVIVGLGNPGPRYSGTRHNIGFLVAAQLAGRWSMKLHPLSSCETLWAKGKALGTMAAVALPQGSMNLSGTSVRCLAKRFRLSAKNLLVVCDDVSLPLGSLRLKASGTDGGHRGLGSVLEAVGTEEVPRLRVGIRTREVKEGDNLTPFVLSRFRPAEERLLAEIVEKAAAACEVWLTEGPAAAMNRFNRRRGGAL